MASYTLGSLSPKQHSQGNWRHLQCKLAVLQLMIMMTMTMIDDHDDSNVEEENVMIVMVVYLHIHKHEHFCPGFVEQTRVVVLDYISPDLPTHSTEIQKANALVVKFTSSAL